MKSKLFIVILFVLFFNITNAYSYDDECYYGVGSVLDNDKIILNNVCFVAYNFVDDVWTVKNMTTLKYAKIYNPKYKIIIKEFDGYYELIVKDNKMIKTKIKEN